MDKIEVFGRLTSKEEVEHVFFKSKKGFRLKTESMKKNSKNSGVWAYELQIQITNVYDYST